MPADRDPKPRVPESPTDIFFLAREFAQRGFREVEREVRDEKCFIMYGKTSPERGGRAVTIYYLQKPLWPGDIESISITGLDEPILMQHALGRNKTTIQQCRENNRTRRITYPLMDKDKLKELSLDLSGLQPDQEAMSKHKSEASTTVK